MWETLARRLPWSWLTCSTIKQALCDYQMTLPMLEIWPSYIRSIMAECLQDPADRPCFCTLHECLLGIKNSGDGLTSEVLDGAFPDWLDFQCGTADKEVRGRRKTNPDLPQRSSTCGTSEIYVMIRRPSSQGNGKRRSTSVRGDLTDILKVFSTRAQDSPREKEIERFGYEIAERLAVVRNIRGVSRNYKRVRWAREVVLTRALEGDIERVRRDEKKATSAKKRIKSSRRGRRYSVFNQKSFERLLVTSSKYLRRDWSKVLHGKEKLKTSMKGFKGKVNEELSEYGRKLLTDDDCISKRSIGYEEADRTESKAESKDSLALLSLWENNRATLTPKTNFSVKGTVQEITHSKVDMDSPSSLHVQPFATRRKAVAQEADTPLSVVRKRSDVISADATKAENVEKINRTNDGEDGIFLGEEYTQRYRSRRSSVTQNLKGNFQVGTNSDTQTVMKDTTQTSEIPEDRYFVILNSPREEPTKLKGEDQSEAIDDAETSLLNEEDLTSSFDLNAKQEERLRTQSLGPTPKEKPISARKSYKPRARSARQVRMETILALPEREGKSDTSTVVSGTEGTSLEKTALTDSDGGNGRLYRFSIGPNMSRGIHLSPTPPQSFGSNDDLRDVRESKSAVNGERVSSVSYIDWSRLKVSDENELDIPTGLNSATGNTERDAIEAEEGTSREMLSCKKTSSFRFPSDKSHRKRAESLRNECIGEFSFDRTTILGEAETTISPCYDVDSHGWNSYIKTEKLRSNSLSQKPIENESTIKCNSLMIKGAGGESMSKRKTNAWEFSKDWSSSNISFKPRSKSLGSDLMAKLGLRRKSGTDRLVHLSKGTENDLNPKKGSECMHASGARSEEPTRNSIQRDIADTNNSFGTKCSSEAIANGDKSVCSTEMVLKDLNDIIHKDIFDESSVDDKSMKAKEKPEVVSDENKTTHNNPAYIHSRQTKELSRD